MSGLNVSVNITGDKAFLSKLVNLASVTDEFHEALEETGKNLTAYFSGQVFESHGGVFGTPWKSLSPSTVAFKSKHFRQFAAVPLQATGTMRKSFKHTAGALKLTIENEAPYFKYHQSTEPRTKIPRRPMFAINKDVKTIVRQSIEKSLMNKLAKL